MGREPFVHDTRPDARDDSWLGQRQPRRWIIPCWRIRGSVIEIVGLFGLLAFVVASLVVGARILMLAARTRLFPETSVGLSLFLSGGVGTALTLTPLFLPDLGERTSYVVFQIGSAVNHVGYGLLFTFVWRVFRRDETWAAALYGLCTLGLIVGGVGMAIEFETTQLVSGRYTPNSNWFWLSLATRFVGYSWAAIESLRYYAMLKKRLALGLADPAVVSRFLYWGVCTSAVVCIWINFAVRETMTESQIVQASSNLVSAVLGFIVAGSLWFAFFPMGSRATDSKPLSQAGQEHTS